jgi:branched-chain amino acid aminotransferase
MSVNWFNGALVEHTFSLDVGDRGFLLGDGVFETIAVNHGQAIWLDEHLRRLEHAATALGIIYDEAELRRGVEAVLHKSVAKFEVMRITLSRGATARGLAVNGEHSSLLISRNLFDPAAQPQSLRLATSLIRRNETAPSSRLKTLSYVDNIAAAREVADEADDALMLNSAGHVACTTVGNIFILRGEDLLTPALDQGVLAGITRAKILELSGFNAIECNLSLDDLHGADCVFITNSLRLVTPVTTLDGKALGQRPIRNLKLQFETLTGRI